MFKRGYKFIFSVVLIATLFLLGNAIAFADPLAGAIVGGMGAMGATIGSTGATVGAYDQFISGNGTNPLSNLDPLGDYQVYYEKNSRTDPTTGITYDTVWFSHDFARYLQDEGIAFLDDHTILPNTQGTLASGVGYAGDVPIYNINGTKQSQVYHVDFGSFSFGDFNFTIADSGSDQTTVRYTIALSSPSSSVGPNYDTYPASGFPGFASIIRINSSNIPSCQVGIYTAIGGVSRGVSLQYGTFEQSSFSFDYVSSDLDLDPIGSDLGLKIEIPSGYIPASVPSGTYTVDGGAGDDTIYQISEAINEAGNDNELEGEFSASPIPVPPTPTPVPTNLPLGEVPYPDFLDTFGQSIYDKLDGLHDIIDTVGRSIEAFIQGVEDAVDTIGQSVVEAIEDAKDSIDTIGQSITGILTDIKNAIISIPQTLAQILEAVITHPIDMFSAYLDAFLQHSGIGGLLDDLKDHLGIWHYVVEWLQCIGGAFAFFFGIMSSTAYCMVVPIYALVAGSICLAIYKRFGR